MSDILMAIKPKYAELIYQDKKLYEIRKKIPKVFVVGEGNGCKNRGMKVYLYESKPVQRITGYIHIGEILYRETSDILRNYNDGLYINRDGCDIDDYERYLGLEVEYEYSWGERRYKEGERYRFAYILQVKETIKFILPMVLKIRPPQNFIYLKEGVEVVSQRKEDGDIVKDKNSFIRE